MVTPVGLARVAEAGVLAHGPQPAPVHRRLDAAGERVLARQAQLRSLVDRRLRGAVQIPELDPTGGLEPLLAKRRLLPRLVVLRAPRLQALAQIFQLGA